MKPLLAVAIVLGFGLAAFLGLVLFKKQFAGAPVVVVVAPAATTIVVTTTPPATVTAPAPAAAKPAPKAASETLVAAETAVQGQVPLDVNLPAPIFLGTPVPFKLPNLEPAPTGKRPDFLVPLGTTNLASGKKVTASDAEPVMGTLDLVTDGDKAGDEGSWVELGPGKQWAQIDLEKEAEIFAVLVWHFHSQARAYLGVVVQISNDPEFKNEVTTIFNNDIQNVQGFGVGQDYAYIEDYQGKLIDAKGVKGRYVRLYSAGNTSNKLNHYTEVEVFGKPVY